MNTQTYTTVKPYKRRKRGTSSPEPTVTTQVIEKPCVHESLEELNHKLMTGALFTLGLVMIGGIVAKHQPVAFWVTLTAVGTWKGLDLWHKHHKPPAVKYVRIQGLEAEELQAQGKEIYTVSSEDYMPVYRDGVLTHFVKKDAKGVKV